MTYVPAAGASGAAAARAARIARQKREEEEYMTPYSQEDLEGWEFKIVRANTRRFRTYQAVQEVCQQESRAGWELVEKFDDQRLRFKRRIEKRSQDRHLDIDPYRTLVGVSEGRMAGVILGVVIGLGILIAILATIFSK